jgi:hypothetical protein
MLYEQNAPDIRNKKIGPIQRAENEHFVKINKGTKVTEETEESENEEGTEESEKEESENEEGTEESDSSEDCDESRGASTLGERAENGPCRALAEQSRHTSCVEHDSTGPSRQHVDSKKIKEDDLPPPVFRSDKLEEMSKKYRYANTHSDNPNMRNRYRVVCNICGGSYMSQSKSGHCKTRIHRYAQMVHDNMSAFILGKITKDPTEKVPNFQRNDVERTSSLRSGKA